MRTRGLFRAVEVLGELAATERFAARTIKIDDALMSHYRQSLDNMHPDARRKYESEIWQKAYEHAARMVEVEAHIEPTQETEIIMEFKMGQD